jgi:hypothetical protein
MTKEPLFGCAAIHTNGEIIVLQRYSPVAVTPKPCAVAIRRASTPLSFPLATGISRWLPALADIPQFKGALRWGNDVIENVRNTSGDKLPLFRNMV